MTAPRPEVVEQLVATLRRWPADNQAIAEWSVAPTWTTSEERVAAIDRVIAETRDLLAGARAARDQAAAAVDELLLWRDVESALLPGCDDPGAVE